MRRILPVIIFLIPFALFSQGMQDTIITKDPLNPKREFWAVRNPMGIVISQGFMLNGKKDGVWRSYQDDKGKLTKLEEYSNGILNGVSITVHINGSVTSDATFLNNKLNGQRTAMSNYGNVKVIETYHDSILDGRKRMYYDNGTLQEDGNWKNAQKDGPFKWYRSDGTLSLENTYVSGVLQGPSKEYDEKGRIKRIGQYLNYNEAGEWQEFKDSVLVKKIIYKDGQVVKEIPVKK